MADENSTLVWWTQTGVQPGDDFVIGFWSDDDNGAGTSAQPIDDNQTQMQPEETKESGELQDKPDDLSDLNIFDSDDDWGQTSVENENQASDNLESSENAWVVTAAPQSESVTSEIIGEPKEPEIVVEKKFVPLDDNIGQDLDVSLWDEPTVENPQDEIQFAALDESQTEEVSQVDRLDSQSAESNKSEFEFPWEPQEESVDNEPILDNNDIIPDETIEQVAEDVASEDLEEVEADSKEIQFAESEQSEPLENDTESLVEDDVMPWETVDSEVNFEENPNNEDIEKNDSDDVEYLDNTATEDNVANQMTNEDDIIFKSDENLENSTIFENQNQNPDIPKNFLEPVSIENVATPENIEQPEAVDFEFNPQKVQTEVKENTPDVVEEKNSENLDFSFDAPIENVEAPAVEEVTPSVQDSVNENYLPEENNQIESIGPIEPAVPLAESTEVIAENNSENTTEVSTTEPVAELQPSTEVKSESSEVQSTLSLDQIMDAELLSSNQILTQPVPVQSPTSVHPEWWKVKNKKILMALMSAGLVLVLWFVTVTAFPDLFTVRDVENPDWTGSVIQQPTIPDDDPIMTPDWHWSAEADTGFGTIDPDIVFPDVDPSYCDELLENCIVNMDDPEDPEDIVPTPYISDDNSFEPERVEPEIQKITVTEVMDIISSFKNQAEVYYNYGQKELDKYIIKYSSQITHLCENYESQIMNWEWLDPETLENFKSRINLLISKINEYNGGSDTEDYTVQEEQGNSDFEWKEAIKDYIYSK